MKKFKLIKEFPGSPELNSVFTKNMPAHYKNGDRVVYQNYIENFPEFWEEVVEKDYEILSFRYDLINTIRWKNAYGMFPYGDQDPENRFSECSEAELLEDPRFSIYSVRRLSDGEVFTVGDKVMDSLTDTLTNYKVQTINHFTGEHKLICVSDSCTTMPLSTVRHREVLFTTTDGVDILGGEIFFHTSLDTMTMKEVIRSRNANSSDKGIISFTFSTREEAEKSIQRTKYITSLQKTLDSLRSEYGHVEEWAEGIKNLTDLINLIKNK